MQFHTLPSKSYLNRHVKKKKVFACNIKHEHGIMSSITSLYFLYFVILISIEAKVKEHDELSQDPSTVRKANLRDVLQEIRYKLRKENRTKQNNKTIK